MAEQCLPGFEMTQWYGLLAPASLPASAAGTLALAAAKAIQSADSLARLQADAAMAVGSTPVEFARFIADEQKRWKPVLARAKVKPD